MCNIQQWEERTKTVVTKYIERTVGSTAHEKRNLDPTNPFNTIPFGYEK